MAPRARLLPAPRRPAADRRRVCLVLACIAVASWAWSDAPSSVGSRAFAFPLARVLSIVAKVVGILLGTVLACVLGISIGGGRLIAAVVKARVEELDRAILGVDVTIESLRVSIHRGLVDIKGLVVANASGYSADYLIRIDRALADVDVYKLLRSGFREIVVERVMFLKVDVIWEKSGMTQSNVKEVLNHISSRKQKAGQDQPSQGSKHEDALAEPKQTSKRKVSFHTVKFEDIGVKMASHLLHGAGMRFALADIDYPDFSADHGSYIMDDIAGILIMSLLKTVVANTAGKSVGDKYF